MTFSVKVPMAITLSLLMFSLSGCGEKTVVGERTTKAEQSQACMECHESAVSPGTGMLIVTEWKRSHHNTSNAAGCADCHEPAHAHPTGCNLCHGSTPAASSVTKNPDTDMKCAKCHGSVSGLFPQGTRHQHYGNTNFGPTIGNYSASYISTNYVGKCRKCHNPHDPTTNIKYNRVWAESGHGEVNAAPRTSRDFKLFGTSVSAENAYTNSSPSSTTKVSDIAKGTPVCVRCHTTTGFINFVERTDFGKKFTYVKPFGNNTGLGGYGIDKTKEVTGCDACHTGYDFKVRAVDPVTIYVNFSGITVRGGQIAHAKIAATTQFPDLKASNVCIPCHSGRAKGSQVKQLAAFANFTSLTSPSSHDLTAANFLTTVRNGYEFAGKEYVTGTGAVTRHDTAGLSTGKGPCITCHMNKTIKSDSHTFKPVVHDTVRFFQYTSSTTWGTRFSVDFTKPIALKTSEVSSNSCNTSSCHVGMTKNAMRDEFNSDKEGYISALAALNQWVKLVRNVPDVDDSLACDNSSNPVRLATRWNYAGTFGPDVMGAAFNLNLLNNEWGAYTHNPLYAKRLVYDSISVLMAVKTQPNVADAINSLVGGTTTFYAGKSGKTAAELLLCTNYSQSKFAITQQQANAAIKWLYGSVSPSDKTKRPGN